MTQSVNNAAAASPAERLMQRLARKEILAMTGYVSARMEAGSAEVILNANENPWAPDLGQAAGDISSWQINRYPPPQPAAVIEQLAELYQLESQQLLVTRGSDEGIDLLTRAFCRAGVDKVVYCPPAFGMYAVSAAIQGAQLQALPLDADWQPDVDAIVAAQPKLLYLCHPNNPTGNLLQESLILQLCQRLQQHSMVIVDEAYIEFADCQSLSCQLARFPNLVILRTLSKAWGLAGLRCGAVLADPAVISLLRKIMAPYPLSIATQALVAEALTPARVQAARMQIQKLIDARAQLFTALTKLSRSQPERLQRIWPSAANFLLLRVDDAAALVAGAAAQGILLRDQSRQPGLHNCVRISIGSATENRRLLHFMEDYCQ
ncbi:MAG: histidinol-phosphate transaminase [Gammaproteobacteria bacterium]|jgi:histidinol-phosphate aminotransferase|nr:histidinol-phosphate transaminase [Gammaproteobacteria bacterium]